MTIYIRCSLLAFIMHTKSEKRNKGCEDRPGEKCFLWDRGVGVIRNKTSWNFVGHCHCNMAEHISYPTDFTDWRKVGSNTNCKRSSTIDWSRKSVMHVSRIPVIITSPTTAFTSAYYPRNMPYNERTNLESLRWVVGICYFTSSHKNLGLVTSLDYLPKCREFGSTLFPLSATSPF